jgi:hypothetical protein
MRTLNRPVGLSLVEVTIILLVPALLTGVLYPFSVLVGPLSGIGWRGPYLPSPIGRDPWGNAYDNSTFAVQGDTC